MRHLRLTLWLLLCGPLAAAPDAGWWAGPLRFGNLHPFQAIFLDTPALDAAIPRRPTFDARLSQFNTMAVSPNVFTTPAGQALRLNEQLGRPQTLLNTASLAASAAGRPGETFLFADTETTRLDLFWCQPLSRRWAVQTELPLLAHTGGVFDSVFDGFHRAFGFGRLGREDAPRNQVQLFAAHGNQSRSYAGDLQPSVGDAVLRVLCATQIERSRTPGVLASFSVKAPTGPSSRFYGSGGWDWGIGLHLAKTMGDFRVYGSGGHTWHGAWKGFGGTPIANTWDFHLGCEARLSPNWSALVQFSRRENALGLADPSSFGRASWLIGTGFAYRAGRSLVIEGGFYENLCPEAYANSYDAGLSYRMRWRL